MQTYCEKNLLAYLCRLANIYTDVTEQIRLVVPEWMKKAFLEKCLLVDCLEHFQSKVNAS